MAAPPLGSTARILLALTMTAIGVAVGAVLGRRLTRSAEPVRSRRRVTVPNSETAEETPAVPRQRASRRRPLAVEPARPKRVEPQILDVADLDPADITDANLASEDTPLRIVRRSALPSSIDTTSFPLADTTDEAALEGHSSTPMSLFEAYSRDIAAPADPELTASPVATAKTDFGLDLHSDDAQIDEDNARFDAPAAIKMNGHSAGKADVPAPEQSEPLQQNATGRQAADRIVSAELDELSPLQLLERLALAMAHRQSLRAAAPLAVDAGRDHQDSAVISQPAFLPPKAGAPLPRAAEPARRLPRGDDQGESEAEGAQTSAPFAAAFVPAALRPIAMDLDHGDSESDEPLPGYIPPRHIGMPATAEMPAEGFAPDISDHDDNEDEEETDVQFDDGYSSLLNMARPMRASPHTEPSFEAEQSIDDDQSPSSLAPLSAQQEVPEEHSADDAERIGSAAGNHRPFDGPAGKAGVEDTEEALRAALATLQRMSGAA